MPELPVILHHNMLKRAVIAADSADSDFPAYRIADDLLHTWWKPESSASHVLTIKALNMLDNPGFEIGIDGWFLRVAGSGAGTFTRNTTAPIEGDGDAELDATTANGSTDKVIMMTRKPFRLKAGRTYRMSFVAKAGNADKDLRYGFIAGDFTETAAYYTDETGLGTAATELYKEITPASDIDLHVYFRALEIETYNIDVVHLCEVRDVDAIVFAKGHGCQGYTYSVKYADSAYGSASFSSWQAAMKITTREAVYATVETAKKAPQWKITIAPISGYSGLDAQEVPLIFLGEQWTLPHHFAGKFDPYEVTNKVRSFKGDTGIENRMKQSSQRMFNATLKNLTSTDAADFEKFFDDTDNGVDPFAFIWKPTSAPTDVLIARLDKPVRKVPYRGGQIRDWPFKIIELPGERNV